MAITKGDIHYRLWQNISNNLLSQIGGVNQSHEDASGSWNFSADPRPAANNLALSAIPYWSEMINVGKDIANYFRYITYALYGVTGNIPPAYNAYAYFYVDPGRHQTHFNNVTNQINNYWQNNPGTGMTTQQVENFYNQLTAILVANRSQQVPDLRVCHGSCHTNCHQSRGRR